MCIRDGYATVDCLRDDDPGVQTNSRVNKGFVTVPPFRQQKSWIAGLTDILDGIINITNAVDFKIVVFFPIPNHVAVRVLRPVHATVRYSRYGHYTARRLRAMGCRRQETSGRHRKTGELLTTDITAQGINCPNVTHVIQFGSTKICETYIHRLSQTAGQMGRDSDSSYSAVGGGDGNSAEAWQPGPESGRAVPGPAPGKRR